MYDSREASWAETRSLTCENIETNIMASTTRVRGEVEGEAVFQG